MSSDSTCLSYHKVWINEVEMYEGGKYFYLVSVKNHDI